MNGSFRVVKISNEKFSKDLSEVKNLELFYKRLSEKISAGKANSAKATFNEILRKIIYVNDIKEMIKTELTKYYIIDTKYKVLANVNIRFMMFCEGKSSDNYYFNSKTVALVGLKQISEYADEVIDSFINAIETAHYNSLFTFDGIKDVNINFARRTKTRAGSYIDILPDNIKNKKAIVNIKNLKDDKCIIWCLVAHKYYDTFKSDKCELYNYKKYENEIIKPKDIKFPIDIQKDIPNFEKLNDIKINVFEYNNDYTHLEPLYNNKKIYSNEVDLLLMKKDNIEHLAYIRDINKLLSVGERKEARFWCKNCLCFSHKTMEALEEHKKLCYNNESTRCIMPTKDNNQLKFKNENHKFKHPFSVFIDFEASLIKTNIKRGTGDIYQHHKINSVGIKYNCIHNEYSKPIKIINNSDEEKILENMMLTLEEYAKNSYEYLKQNEKHIAMNKTQYKQHEKQTTCKNCNRTFDDIKIKKVVHHNHITGEYIETICSKCNLKFQYKKFLPCYIHNLKNYDGHFIIKALTKYGYQSDEMNIVNAIPNNEERYISFSKKIKVDTYQNRKTKKETQLMFEIRFLDTFAFMASSLSNLVDNLKGQETDIPKLRKSFKNTSEYFKDDEQFKLMIRKGIYPYDFVDDYKKLYIWDELPSKKSFYSKLNDTNITDEEYENAKKVWDTFNCKKFIDYHNIYLTSDVLLLADIWENFKETCYKIYGLDTSYYYTSPGLSFDAFLKHKHDLTEGKFFIELLTDIDQYNFIESGIRGGISQISKRYAKANNKYMTNYNEKKMDEYILYLDANNLYGYAMSKYLPMKHFKWNTNNDWVSEFNEEKHYYDNVDKILNIPDDSNIGYTFSVDLHYPDELHDHHNNYPLACENMQTKKEYLNEWQQENYKESKIKKLLLTFFDKKDYVINYRLLKLYLQLGLKIKKVNKVLQYKQENFMESYILKNTNERKQAKNDFEKDFYKLMNNSVYGKTLENVKNRINFILVDSEKRALAMKNYFKKITPFNKNLVGVHLCKKEILLNKPIFIGQTVLDQSKYLMYNFHYNHMLKHFKRENIDLLFTDTDSLCYHIKNQDPFEYMYQNKSLFDLSEYSKDYFLHDTTNKKVIGKFKNESSEKQIVEFVGLKSKLYSYKCDEETETHNKCKGIKSYISKKLITESYKKILFNRKKHRIVQNGFITEEHEVYTVSQEKIAISANDDKIYVCDDNINTINFGHKNLRK